MKNQLAFMLAAGLLLATGTVSAQTTATTQASTAAQAATANRVFDVASVRPSVPPDMTKMMADLAAGKRPESMRIDGLRATFTYMSLKELIAYAYKARSYQVSGPEWMTTDRFDILANLPEGASRDDVPVMMQALLAERFKLATHQATIDQPVLALMVAKGGAKLKEATDKPVAIDESLPLKPGESRQDSVDGPIHLIKNPDGSTTYNLGARGSFTLKFDGETRSMHMQADSITMKGFAGMMTTRGGGEGRQIVDQTGLTGNYQAAVDFSLADLMASLHDSGINLPTRPASTGGEASEPEGYATVSQALAKLGLRLEKSRAQLDRLVVDHIEKMPTEN
jgi:uncharacterized protein (TIGR03435 family)